MTDRAELFLDKYKQLENIVKSEYRLDESDSAMGFLIRRKAFRNIQNELDLCRETRNLLAHNPKVGKEYAVEPTESMINLLDMVIEKVKNPLRATDVMVKRNDICLKTMGDRVRETMVKMNMEGFTHVPIVENDVVIGVFSENTVFSIILDEEIADLDEGLRFNQIKKYLSCDREGAESYRFIGKNTLVSDIGEMYKENSQCNARIGMIFVTENGKKHEKLLGLITAWDIAAEADV